MTQVAAYLISTVLLATTLWLAMKITSVRGAWLHLLLAAGIANLVGLIPVAFLGTFLPVIVLLFLISKLTSAEIWPDAVLIVIISWGLNWVISIIVISKFLQSLA